VSSGSPRTLDRSIPYHDRMAAEPVLVTVELRFKTSEDPEQLGDRIRESVAMIVGQAALEEFRVRVLPLGETKPRGV
jgi:hypothetical protein